MPTGSPPTEFTWWNGEPAYAVRGTAVVADDAFFPKYWAREEGILGQRIAVVMVIIVDMLGEKALFLDNRNGEGWSKVTEGKGSWRIDHKEVTIVPGSYETQETFFMSEVTDAVSPEVPPAGTEQESQVVVEPFGGTAAPTFIDKARQIVFEYVRDHLDRTDGIHATFAWDEVYIVWFSKTLKNWKALISTTLPDGMYYEVTYNGQLGETYLDVYKKFDNLCIPDHSAS